MGLINDISELVTADVIDQQTAEKIEKYYQLKKDNSPNKLFIVFGIIGALLVGMGIILIVAHNWDSLSRVTKTVLAIFPMIIGQAICAFTILKKKGSVAWRESAATFLIFAVGASIAMISQVYNVEGDLGTFLLTWTLLSIPLIYAMSSSAASLLSIIGASFYAMNTGYWNYPSKLPIYYFPLILAIIPHYWLLIKNKPKSNFTTFHHWFFSISLTACLGVLAQSHEELMFLAYICLFGFFYHVGHHKLFKDIKLRNNAYLIIGALGTMNILIIASFNWFWKEVKVDFTTEQNLITSPEFIAAILLTGLAIWMWINNKRANFFREMKPVDPVFVIFFILFVVGMFNSVSMILINILVLVVGILTIREGARKNHLVILNYGLLSIATLIACRFFDGKMSFVFRGILFIAVGVGFFMANFYMLKRRKGNEQR